MESKPKVTRDSILKVMRVARRDLVTIPGFEGTFLKAVSELEVQQWAGSLTIDDAGNTQDPYVRAKLVQICLVDENNQPIFGEPNDYMLLVEDRTGSVAALYRQACRFNGIGKEGEAELRKNSKRPGADSSSA